MIFRSSSSTSSVGIPSERSILRNSFIPLISKLHSKSVNLIFVVRLIKNYLLLFGSFILPYIRRLVECVDFNKNKKERNLKSIKFLSNFVLTVPIKCFLITSLSLIGINRGGFFSYSSIPKASTSLSYCSSVILITPP